MMNKILYKNLNILDPTGSTGFLPHTWISVIDGIIDQVGPGAIPTEKFDEIYDLQGKTVMPGMINAHTHLYSALALGMPYPPKLPRNFKEILENIWWKLDLALDEDSTAASFQAGLLLNLLAGVTTVLDHHSSQNFIRGSTARLVATAEQYGLRAATAFELTDRNGPRRFLEGLAENCDALQTYKNHPLVHPLMGLHASFTLSDDSLTAIAQRLADLNYPGIHIHIGEDLADQEDAVRRGYRSVIDRLNSFGLITANSLLIHGIYLQPDDIQIIQEKKAFLVHCPSSNANNRVGMLAAHTIEKLQAGLGTDGMQANMRTEVKEGQLIRSSHLQGGEPNVDYSQLLFKNNPHLASRLFDQKIGRIEAGCVADLAVYDYSPHTNLKSSNALSHVIWGLPLPCHVITGGVFRIRDHKLVGIDMDLILGNARAESEKLWAEMQQIGV